MQEDVPILGFWGTVALILIIGFVAFAFVNLLTPG